MKACEVYDDIDDDNSDDKQATDCAHRWCVGTNLNYRDENFPKSDHYVGKGRYTLSFDVTSTDPGSPNIDWTSHHNHMSNKKLSDGLIFTLNKYAHSEKWDSKVNVTGYTLIKKHDPSTNDQIQFRCDKIFHGHRRYDWGLFTWEDDKRPENTLNAGHIMGFVCFENTEFPTTRWKKHRESTLR